MHSLKDLDNPIQVISLDIPAFGLSYSPYGISIRDEERDTRMAPTKLKLLGPKLTTPATPSKEHPGVLEQDPEVPDPMPDVEDPPSGSGLTPPSSPSATSRPYMTPQRSTSAVGPSALSRAPFSTAIAETLVVNDNGLQAVAPTPVVIQLEQLCADRRMDEAMKLVDEERRKGRRGEIDGDKATHQATMRLLHLYLACHLLLETMFEKAGEYFHKGKVDPRLLVRLYPALRGKTIGSAEEVETLDGLAKVFEEMPPISDISEYTH